MEAIVIGSLPSATAPTRDAAVGMVLGAAIGDALGHPTEFLHTADERRKHLGVAQVQDFELWWDRDGKRFAPYTDDTQLAEVVLRGLLWSKREGASLDGTMTHLAKLFVEWARAPQGGHRAPGRACLAGCIRLADGVPWREAGSEDAGGCGSVMRAYPFGLVFVDDLEKAENWAVEHSRLTHNHPIALAACAAMAVGSALALREEPVASILGAMATAAARWDQETSDMIRQAADDGFRGVSPEVTLVRLQGWAAHEAIAAGAYLLARHRCAYAIAVLEGANAPGDSDSIASIAGALVGGRLGVSRIPSQWVRDVERSKELAALAARTAQ